jgi:hypothetical protein
MDTTASSFSTRSNAKRAAERMIGKGTAPERNYALQGREGRFEIVWKRAPITTESTQTANAQSNQYDRSHMPQQESEPRQSPGGSGIFRETNIRAYEAESDAKPATQPGRNKTTGRKKASLSKYGIDPKAVDAGRLPEKPPVVTSAANLHYQKHFDRLFELAKTGNWDALGDYLISGSNSYAKRVARYREDLLALRAASKASR